MEARIILGKHSNWTNCYKWRNYHNYQQKRVHKNDKLALIFYNI